MAKLNFVFDTYCSVFVDTSVIANDVANKVSNDRLCTEELYAFLLCFVHRLPIRCR